ncbi:ComEC/Rec2 family competence protein [Leisingera sp. S232]|uniref:ComEC/Rec2 family competence protein n=1 Tax=Leisingera sp. S232 TaxID=3415132 RepID=UPI003C7A4D02
MRLWTAFSEVLHTQRGSFFCWVPVFLGAGIAVYFHLKFEPGPAFVAGLAGAALFLAAGAVQRLPMAFLLWIPALIAGGFCLASARTHLIAAPVLDFRYYGPVEGRVAAVDRSSTGALRLTLDQVRLDRVSPEKTPFRVRLSLKAQENAPLPGTWVMTTAHLLPPQGPVEPGGFDFRRHAWFKRLGGLGYTRVPVLLMETPGSALPVAQLRRRMAEYLQQQLPGKTGGFAAAVTAGDRSGVGAETLTALRRSNLAHLLAISGLHMGLLTGFVFAALRTLMCLSPWIALRWPIKKLAAAAALVAGAGYLLLSGGNVATERAFVMVAVMFGAVLLNRRAITLRAVAVAAVIVLLRRPESLLSPGFQMSFAATAALVAVFAALRDRGGVPGPRWLKPVSALVISSAVAGAATAPFAAAHFNTIPHYGLVANLLSVPVMGTVVIPAAVVTLCLSLFGLEWIGLTVMNWGMGWILAVAEAVSGFEGAVSQVAAPGAGVMPLFAAGMIFAVVWQGRLRLGGLVPVTVAMWLWSTAERPDILIADSGGLVGVMTSEGRALSRAKGQGFTARIWLENDGDRSAQPVAASRWVGGLGPLPAWEGQGFRLVHAPGKRKLQLLSTCKEEDVVVSTVPGDNHCLLLTPEVMRQTGSLALTRGGKLVTARDLAGERPWTDWQPEGAGIRRLRQLWLQAADQ